MTTIPPHSFLTEWGKHDVTLTSFTADLSEPWNLIWSGFVTLMKQGACEANWRFLLSFISFGKKSEGGVSPPAIGERVNIAVADLLVAGHKLKGEPTIAG